MDSADRLALAQYVPQAMFFGPEDAALFGVWHQAIEPHAGSGPAPFAVVMVPPWGAEDMSAHRSLRGLAKDISAMGLPCLRFDLPGCGDSYATHPETDQWALWCDAVIHAIALAKYLSKTQQVVLVGTRLGALLASHMAARCAEVMGLVVLAPVRSGKAYLRELRMLGGVMAQGDVPPAGTADAASGANFGATLALFAAGFVMNAATVNAISAQTLPTVLAARQVAVIDRDDLAMGRAWGDKLQGSQVTYTAAPGYAGMVVTAHKAQPATAMFEAALHALAGMRQELALPDTPWQSPDDEIYPSLAFSVPAQLHAQSVELQSPWGHSIIPRRRVFFEVNGVGLVERFIAPTGAGGIAGIWVEPAEGTPRSGKTLVIVNSSAERRIGPNGMWVAFSRERAALGDTVIRLDLPGYGESLRDCLDPAQLVYPPDTLRLVNEFIKYFASGLVASHWAVLGLCSGGYHGYRWGVMQARIERILSVNNFGLLKADVYDFGEREQASAQYVVAHAARQNIFKLDRWVKLLRGNVNLGLIVSSLWWRVLGWVQTKGVKIAIQLGLMRSTLLMRELQRLHRRGCRVHFVYSKGDPGPAILRDGSAQEAIQLVQNGTITEDIVDNADHTFANLAGRAEMFKHLHRRLDEWVVKPHVR